MRLVPDFPAPVLAIPALALAAAAPLPAQPWQPMDLQTCNRTGRSWMLVRDAAPDWELAFSDGSGLKGEDKAERAPDREGHFGLEPGLTLRLNVRRIQRGEAQGLAFTLADPEEPTHRAAFTLPVTGVIPETKAQLGPDHACFRAGQLFPGKGAGPLLVVTGRVLLLLDPLPGDPGQAGAALGEPPGAASLRLSEEQALAGVREASTFYTLERMPTFAQPGEETALHRADLAALHAAGHRLPEELLACYFLNTLFPYYTWSSIRIEARQDYSHLLAEARTGGAAAQRLLFPPALYSPFLSSKRKEEFGPYLDSVRAAIRSFQCNPRLVWLGIAYLRQKVLVEKLEDAARAAGSGEHGDRIQRILLRHDRYAGDLQAMIHAWMFQGYRAYLQACKEGGPERWPRAGDMLADYQPEFLREPRYAFYMEHLKQLTAPVPKVEAKDF